MARIKGKEDEEENWTDSPTDEEGFYKTKYEEYGVEFFEVVDLYSSEKLNGRSYDRIYYDNTRDEWKRSFGGTVSNIVNKREWKKVNEEEAEEISLEAKNKSSGE